MALTDKQITSVLEEIVKGLNFSALKESVHMQLLSMTLAASYAELGQHKNTNYVIDKTMQIGMLVGYLLKEKESEIEALERLHGENS